jgi:dipeptidyl aminopeptidase/acylaminoacyl peptidase
MISPIDMWAEPASPAVELHLFDPNTGTDRIVATAPGDRVSAQFAFRREGGDVAWLDGRRIAYRLEAYDAQGRRLLSHWVVGVDGAAAKEVAEADFPQGGATIPTGDGVLALDGEGAARRLVTRGSDGTIRKDHGPVSFTHMGGGRGHWHSPESDRMILGVRYPDRDGLMLFPATSAGTRLARIGDSLSDCAFAADLTLGVCNRESLERAPELVAVDPATARVRVLARPNAHYDRIAPLKTARARWTSRLGSDNDGYITYPRGYRTGRKYPTLIVTHAGDARNRFADPVFQWQYPVQFFAEHGYLVLSVNEARKDRDASRAYGAGKGDVPVAKMQAEWGLKPVASMEAAALALIDQGVADPDRIGIAGYSRGASVTTFALSQSKLFRAGASGDADWFSAGSYWDSAVARGIYDGVFGGSPLDPLYFENYQALSPSARTEHFCGPLLQQFTAATAAGAVELDAALKVANVPAELVFYPGETHVFHKSRHRASAMRLSFDWFDYWLQGRRDTDEGKAAQYWRWDNMAAGWRSSRGSGPTTVPK